jgi:DNA-binding NarL/FixJ family response regulator
MWGLLRQLQARGGPAQYGTTLLRAFGPDGSMNLPSSPPGSVGAIEPLTERERDVLRLWAAGQSNPEIARALYVEVNTVINRDFT